MPGSTAPPSDAKAALRRELLAHLEAALAAAEAAHAAATEGATHAEARPENSKDTRALEQSYLARGQAARVEELRTAVTEVTAWTPRAFAAGAAIGLGALVTVEEDGAEARYLVAPHGGGARLDDDAIGVVTPRSPLGRALVGRRAGDDVEVRLPGRLRELVITAVA
ncbi:MAG: GreA/GreB family elongation factor [Kofleriaceae bacterium]|nr:GreA/GreB family elongation factor [Kofleriaceae bacterium]